MKKLRAKPIDLMQVHNLVDVGIHLDTLRGWKKDGIVRYLGVTHYTASQHVAVVKLVAAETLDFLQINYSIGEREAEDKLLPLAKDRGVVVIGGPAEAELGKRVAEGIGPSAICLAGATDIPQLAAVLKRCDLLLTNDTGPMHVADAVRCPIVAVFGPTDWITTPPFGPRHVIVRKEIECAPCLKRSCPLKHHHCMEWITAAEVAEACRGILGGAR